MTTKSLREGWQLLVRVAVDASRRIQCQCRGCGQTVYADIHLIQWPDGEIACWGSQCFKREMGIAGKNVASVYSRVNGYKLTSEERDLLDANRAALIARIKGIQEDLEQAEKRREESLNKMAKPIALPSSPLPVVSEPVSQQNWATYPPNYASTPPQNYNERSHKFSITFRNPAGGIMKRLYRGDEQFCRHFVDQNIDDYPSGTIGEITVTQTGKLLYQRRKV